MRVLFTANPGFGHVHPMMAPEACGRIEAAGAAGRLAAEIDAMPGPDEVAGVLEGLA